MRNIRLWLIAIGSLGVVVALWSALQPAEPETEPAASEVEPPRPPSELAHEAASTAPEIAPEAAGPNAPHAEVPQPSAADAPAAATTDPAPSAQFVNTPRKRSAEPMRLHFANTPQTPTPGIGLSKAACAELREREQRAESLSDRERLHLRIDCRGR